MSLWERETELIGTNVDPFGHADPQAVHASGATWIRLVLKADVDVQRIVAGYRAAGLKVLGVLARESMETALVLPGVNDWIGWYGQRVGSLVDVLQVGNEPDHTSPSSWTMPLRELTQLGRLARSRFPSHVPLVMGGLASGDPHYLDTDGSWLGVFDLLSVHPYTQTPDTIKLFLGRYRVRAYNHPIWVTEFAWYDGIARSLTELVPVSLVYTWQDWPGWLSGLHDLQGRPKREYTEFFQLATEVNRPMPEFHFGFKDYANAHPEVGKALSDERYFAEDLSCQLADGGLLLYARETNSVRFIPAAKS